MDDYVGDPYPYAKFHHDTITPFASRICENAINTSNDAVSRKDVPFWGLEHKILHFDPIPPRSANFSPIFDGTENFASERP